MSCPVCGEIMEFIFKDGRWGFVCLSCDYEEEVEHAKVKL